MTDLVLNSAVGDWSPIVLLASIVVLVIIAYIIRSTGSGKHKKGTEQGLPFFSGNKAPEVNIHPANLYWGFLEAMKRYYGWLLRMHDGMVNNYVFSFVVLVIIMIAAMLLGGLI